MSNLMYVLGPALTALAGLALRLWFKAVRERSRQQTLRTLSSALPAGGAVEIKDNRDDGSSLHIRIDVRSGTS